MLLSPAQRAIAQSSPTAPAPTPFESVEFSPEDVLNPATAGFQAIYVDSVGNVLGAFFAIPGARLKIHANGLVEIDQRDYTTEANYCMTAATAFAALMVPALAISAAAAPS
ncbi:hypothetical protein [Phormidium sp. FACHB-77]|uniref:hypothetical protein n=1 Tax=Cyanophyceae TaxID=3028117 RepID=UPI0016869A8A|nr:hypothetical protein [Phormidium sp. FACHB-77]MBD1919328.1 hypothetical protein [Phormidium sp. FACHB-77]